VTNFAPTTDVAPDSTLKPEDVIEVLRQCYDPEIPVNIIDLGLIYEIAIKPERVDVKMTLTALGCPMAAEVIADVRDHLLTLPGVVDASVAIVYEPVWTPERMTEDARWELGMVGGNPGWFPSSRVRGGPQALAYPVPISRGAGRGPRVELPDA